MSHLTFSVVILINVLKSNKKNNIDLLKVIHPVPKKTQEINRNWGEKEGVCKPFKKLHVTVIAQVK